MASSPVLVAQRLTKTVVAPEGDLTLLHGIDLEIAAGDSLAITGPSGSGKSTLLSLLAGLDVPSGGNVTLAGQPFSDQDEDTRAALRGQYCSFVFQSFHLVADLSAVENVMLPLEIAGDRQARDKAHHWLQRVGLEHRQHHFPAQLSGGEQQRVALARAFAMAPRVLFADEPTGSLDRANGEQIAGLLFSLNRDHGTALVLVTHDPELAAHCARHRQLVEGRLGD